MKRSRISPVSVKRKREWVEYRKLGNEFLKNKVCERCNTKGFNLDIHHKAGRGKFYLAVDTWMAVCRTCHEYIHKWPKESREKGWLV